jgi:hypothetical protein
MVSKVRWSRSTPSRRTLPSRRRSRDAQADYLLAAKANQPTLRSEIEIFFADASPASLESTTEVDKGHGASSSEPSPSLARPTGSMVIAGSPAKSTCRASRRSSGSPHGPN